MLASLPLTTYVAILIELVIKIFAIGTRFNILQTLLEIRVSFHQCGARSDFSVYFIHYKTFLAFRTKLIGPFANVTEKMPRNTLVRSMGS